MRMHLIDYIIMYPFMLVLEILLLIIVTPFLAMYKEDRQILKECWNPKELHRNAIRITEEYWLEQHMKAIWKEPNVKKK